MHFLGIEIGGTKLQIAVGDQAGNISHRTRLAVDKKEGATGICRNLENVITQLLPSLQLSAVALGFGGPVDWQTGKICVSHQIAGWSGFDMHNWLHTLTDVPVYVENDANVAALGEAIHGAGADYSLVFYITLGSGVGGGLVANGTIYHGALPGEAEVGHIRLDRAGNTVETACSGWAVDRKIREAAKKHEDSLLSTLTAQVHAGEARVLATALAQGDTVSVQILKEVSADLSFGLSHVVHLFHPDVIVIGGGLSLIGEPLRKAIEEKLPAFVMEAFLPGPHIRLAALGEDAVPKGALELARRKFFGKVPEL